MHFDKVMTVGKSVRLHQTGWNILIEQSKITKQSLNIIYSYIAVTVEWNTLILHHWKLKNVKYNNKLASLIKYAWWNDLMDIRQNKWCISTAQSIILEFNNIISSSLEVWKERHKPWCSFTVKVCTTMKFIGYMLSTD